MSRGQQTSKLQGDASVASTTWAGAPPPTAILQSFVTDLQAAMESTVDDRFNRIVELISDVREANGCLFAMGNGGSSSTASHLVCDLMKTVRTLGGRPVRGCSLTDNVPVLTALANDDAYDAVFAQQLRELATPDDLVVAVSVSGRSPNIVAGLEAAAQMGVRTVGMLGSDGGAALDLVDTAIHIPFEDPGIVESAHLAIVHVLAKALACR